MDLSVEIGEICGYGSFFDSLLGGTVGTRRRRPALSGSRERFRVGEPRRGSEVMPWLRSHPSSKFEKAPVYATRVHGEQLRKKTKIPYAPLGSWRIEVGRGSSEPEC